MVDVGDYLGELTERFRGLAAEVSGVWPYVGGTVNTHYVRCGKPNCHCAKGPGHGPYTDWTRKIAGKTVTRRLSESQAAVLRELTENGRRRRQVLRAMDEASVEFALLLLVQGGTSADARAREVPGRAVTSALHVPPARAAGMIGPVTANRLGEAPPRAARRARRAQDAPQAGGGMQEPTPPGSGAPGAR